MDRIASIQSFVRAAEAGSFSRAAADLQLTQPTITKQVAALERHLDTRLFHRNTRGLTLTEVGALYYEKCKALLDQFAETESVVDAAQRQMQGTLRIATSVAFGRRVVTPRVMEFMKRHPLLSVDLGFEDAFTDLVARGIDVALRMGRLADSTLGARYLGSNPWLTVASPAYLKKHSTPREPADLARHNVLIYSSVQGDDRLHYLSAEQRRHSVAVRGTLRSNNLSAIVAGLRAHLGVAALPRYVATRSLREGRLVEVLDTFMLPAQEIHAVYPAPRQVPAKVEALIAFLHGHFRGAWWEQVD